MFPTPPREVSEGTQVPSLIFLFSLYYLRNILTIIAINEPMELVGVAIIR
ncbi:hypothetical protein A45J_0318 [hot springs metagenome]|uniref:Uncharacterized protein n=1 Tax=hot springs metagenome TaxID=433727 RepID=A0A5J4L194_9ZZZZ